MTCSINSFMFTLPSLLGYINIFTLPIVKSYLPKGPWINNNLYDFLENLSKKKYFDTIVEVFQNVICRSHEIN